MKYRYMILYDKNKLYNSIKNKALYEIIIYYMF